LTEEFERVFAELKELRKTVEDQQAALTSLEKRLLLRVRGNQYCRQCHSYTSKPEPPLSEWEQKYHEANHATGHQADPSRRLSAHGPTVSWDDVEAQLVAIRRASGR
jgi:nitrate/TMAO reductase-like tetraheme cytochrome c subunit